MKRFTNIIDYAENEKRSFLELPFTPVDSLILSQLSYVSLDEIFASQAQIRIFDLLKAEYFDKMLYFTVSPNSTKRLLYALCASPRFRNIIISNYVNEVSLSAIKQFCAMTYLLDDGTAYIAYRGTDGSIIGWKEDFLLCFGNPIPSQLAGIDYLEGVASACPNIKLRVGGHSKGGNIAVYSASNCSPSTAQRIINLYSHDAPGFSTEFYESAGYLRINNVFHNTLPQSSVIGMILGCQDNYRVIASSRKWFMQHDPFSWRVNGTDFVYADKLSKSAYYTRKTFNNWLNKMSYEEREAFIETLFNVCRATEFDNVYDFIRDWKAKTHSLLKQFKCLSPERKKTVKRVLGSFAAQAVKSLPNFK